MLECDVRRIIEERGCTAILVTHDIDEAVSISDRVVVLGGKPASVKLDVPIVLTVEGTRTPVTSREAPEFRSYHKTIWEQLEVTLPGAA
jgi:NitT/TauT family transport system ATP-binding protein